MIDPENVPEVGDDELLARYLLHGSHIRRSDHSVKPDAFIPHPYPDLSVTRHLLMAVEEIWTVGRSVAVATGKTLHGRADVRVAVCLAQLLRVRAAPTNDNPNHANVTGWPADKPAQKIIAQAISAAARFVANT